MPRASDTASGTADIDLSAAVIRGMGKAAKYCKRRIEKELLGYFMNRA
jgi:hypothetical protein